MSNINDLLRDQLRINQQISQRGKVAKKKAPGAGGNVAPYPVTTGPRIYSDPQEKIVAIEKPKDEPKPAKKKRGKKK
jgi:hypothetical protein